MAEVEIHTEHGHSNDEFGRRVGVMVGVIGIVLAVVTISSHRAHTAAVIARTEANDQWSFFQSKKLRQHLAEIGSSLATALAPDPARVQGLVEKLEEGPRPLLARLGRYPERGQGQGRGQQARGTACPAAGYG